MEPEQWLAQYHQRLSEIAARADEAGTRLKQVGQTATSPRGEVRVTVGAGGVLEDLTLTPAARTLESDELARLIMETARRARRAVTAQVAGVTTECFGEGPALEVIKRFMPSAVTPTVERRAPAEDPDDAPLEITHDVL